MPRAVLIVINWRSAPLLFKTDQDPSNTRCALNRYMSIYMWFDSTNENAEHIGAGAGPVPFRFTNGAGPAPAPFLRFGVDSYFQDSIMTIEDQNGVDRVDRKAQWPPFHNKETRFCFVAQRVTNMRWGRPCWDCPEIANQTPESRLKCGGEVVATSVAGASCLCDQLSQRSCEYSTVRLDTRVVSLSDLLCRL